MCIRDRFSTKGLSPFQNSVSYTHLDVYKRQVEDDVSSNCSLSFCGVPGRAKKCFNVVVPSAWNDRESVKWGSESDFERVRVIEWFKLKRGYRELVGMLDVERVDDIESVSYTHLYTERVPQFVGGR